DATSDNSENADLLRLKEFIRNPVDNEQYLDVITPELKNVVNLINELISNSETPFQVLLFTVKANDGVNASLDKQNEVMSYLETAISRSIKGKDYMLKFSNTQRMIVLTKSEENGASVVSTHVMKEFYKLYNSKEINVSFDTIEFI
ncbi:MAG: hypothetical protein Q4D51_08070, partial [Eubacteriales bacterium]|nr:hypothetical protein [Eubacteriales bacterium]